MEHIFSKHALEQLLERGITTQQVEYVLNYPQQIIEEATYLVYQAMIKFGDKEYLVRVFLNKDVSPNRVITVYKTSKINKYNEGEI